MRKRVERTVENILAPLTRHAQKSADLAVYEAWRRRVEASRNPLNKRGQKHFSQTDEDGITLEILRRLGVERGTYAELGVGDGTENNTLILAASGWRGFWAGGQDLAFRHEGHQRFCFLQRWITRDNVVATAREGMSRVNADELDLISLDLDGNDYYFVAALLEAGLTPSVFIVEYNGRFPPPLKFVIEYDPDHTWQGDDYFGASLASFAELFDRHGYQLVCCNAHTGANAFFVRKEHKDRFADVPTDLEDLYFPPSYHLYSRLGHRRSGRTIERILAMNPPVPT